MALCSLRIQWSDVFGTENSESAPFIKIPKSEELNQAVTGSKHNLKYLFLLLKSILKENVENFSKNISGELEFYQNQGRI